MEIGQEKYLFEKILFYFVSFYKSIFDMTKLTQRPWVAMLNQELQVDGSYLVDITLDDSIPEDFSIENLVSMYFSDSFSSDGAGYQYDYIAAGFNTKSFLSLISMIRMSGWNIIGITSSFSENNAPLKTFFLEFGNFEGISCF